MRLNPNALVLAAICLLAVLGMGCGGISTSQSVSPASFFLPGLMQSTPKAVDPLAPAFSTESQTVAQVR